MKTLRMSKLMKPIALALIVFLPTLAEAQNPAPSAQKPPRSKLKWIAVGSVIGGAGLALAGVMSKNDATTAARTTTNSTCTTTQTGGGTAVAVACISTVAVVAVAGGGPIVTVPVASVPGSQGTPPLLTSPSAFRMSGVPTSTISLATIQQRGINWKLVVPSIGAASVGTFVLYRDHARRKSAELSVRPDGTGQFTFKW